MPLNCWLVSRWLWIRSRMKAYWWTRRSLHFNGAIPHSGVAYHGPWRKVFVVEYVPPKNDLGTWRNLMVLFLGRYRVWEFRSTKCVRFNSLAEVEDYLNKQGVVE